MQDNSTQNVLETFLEEVRLTETAQSAAERMAHYKLAKAGYDIIMKNENGDVNSDVVERASFSMQHLKSLVEGDEGALHSLRDRPQ